MRSLADGKLKFTILTTAPADPANPTVTELEAGLDGSPRILTSDFNFTNAESTTYDEKPLSQKGQAQTLGASQYTLGATIFREWDPTSGGSSVEDDVVYQALKAKGTTVWCYARETDKDATEPWAEGDEFYLGGEVQTDAPARVGNEGAIKRRVIFLPQSMIDGGTVATAAV